MQRVLGACRCDLAAKLIEFSPSCLGLPVSTLPVHVRNVMRAVVLLLLASLTVSTSAAAAPKLLWETKGLAQPESVAQDPATGALYVSNIAGAVMQKDG